MNTKMGSVFSSIDIVINGAHDYNVQAHPPGPPAHDTFPSSALQPRTQDFFRPESEHAGVRAPLI